MADNIVPVADQYRELHTTSRHYDNQMWVIPGIAFTVSAVFYGVILDAGTAPPARLGLSLIALVVFCGFWLQFAKARQFQLHLQRRLNDIKPGENAYVGAEPDASDAWYLRILGNRSAANWMFAVMTITLFVLFVAFIISTYFCYAWLSPSFNANETVEAAKPARIISGHNRGSIVGAGSMSISIDPLASLLALSALLVAALAYRSSCRIWLQLLEVRGHSETNVEVRNGELFHQFDVAIRNLGITLHDVKVYLWFRDIDGGSWQIELKRVEFGRRHKEVSNDTAFQQGMVAAFALSSFDPTLTRHGGHGISMLRQLDDPKKRDAQLRVYSQEYLVYKFRLWHRFYGLKTTWNRFAYRVNSMFDRKVVVSDGGERLKLGKVLPKCNTDSQFRLEYFVQQAVSSSRKSSGPDGTA